MHDIDALFEKLRDEGPLAAVRIKEAHEAGRKIVGTYCAFTPCEVIRAAGAIPIGLCATSEKPIAAGEEHLPRNLCPLIKASYGFALTDTCPYFHFCDMVVGETTCDGKKKMYELLNRMRKTHVMQLPQTVGPDAEERWEAEMRRLADALEETLGAKITDEALVREIKVRNEERRILTSLFELMKLNPAPVTGLELHSFNEVCKLTFGEPERLAMMREAVRQVRESYEAGERRVKPGTKRIIVTGCPTGKSVEKVFRAIEDNGGSVVAFENCGGVKPNYELVDETLPPYKALAKKYLAIPCSCMTPNEERMRLLKQLVREYQADGVVDLILQTCLTYSVESFRVGEAMKEIGVPFISVETDYYQGDVGQLKTRMGAFIEMM